MDYNFQGSDASDDELYKQHEYSSEGIDSETETTLLGYVHYNSVTLNSKPQPQTKDTPRSEGESSEGRADSGSEDSSDLEAPVASLKEVTVSFQPTQLNAETPRELFIPKTTQFALRSRYFSEPTSVQCYNCQKTGHISFDCPSKKASCPQCKSVKHRIPDCPLTICLRCLQFGHSEHVCNFKSTNQKCTLCNSEKHSSKGCRVFWREYLDLKQSQTSERLSKWCYHCGDKDHFGDSCKYSADFTTSFCGSDANDQSIRGSRRVNPLYHAYFTEPILSDIPPETAASGPDNRFRSYKNNHNRQPNINNRLGFAPNVDRERFNQGHARNDGFGSRANMARRTDGHNFARDNYRNFDPRDAPNFHNPRNFRGASPPRNGSKYGLSDFRSRGFK